MDGHEQTLVNTERTGAASEAEEVALRQAITRARLLENEHRLTAAIESLDDSLAAYAEAPLVEAPQCHPKPSVGPKQKPYKPLQLEVSGLNGKLLDVSADPAWTVHTLKSKVAAVTCTPVHLQRLFSGISELLDEDVLSDVTPPTSPTTKLSLLRTDPEWFHGMQMVTIAGMQLAVLAAHFKADHEIVLTAVRQNGMALEYAATELHEDVAIVRAAVEDSGLALKHAAAALRSDREIVLAAVQQHGMALQYAATELRADCEVVLAAVENMSAAFQHATEALREDRDFVLTVLQRTGLALQFVSRPLRANRDIVVAAVRSDGLALEFASEEWRADREVVLEAVQMSGLALWDAAEHLKRDPQMVAAARWG
mmetsp:Transcript_126058/g.251676  ORF Transcript_126058/g.251676 Transcript_126058/m.251676 type:complete len:369 (-) Transcript_126058:52-1158(-)|eukprot:CAMPEP_0172810402 /NCGR_PEP_ID=MMETSP1075-20121228/8778_1 /TAXON_ID=2916 /ORGANISM="Ceratium fusus, Strain PA161109" /LENGTH=368 /DNA_ID=CAMNT_0013649707 /DNA_START=39 /DNA_END=1145 /DNA_ORIENTATION=-